MSWIKPILVQIKAKLLGFLGTFKLMQKHDIKIRHASHAFLSSLFSWVCTNKVEILWEIGLKTASFSGLSQANLPETNNQKIQLLFSPWQYFPSALWAIVTCHIFLGKGVFWGCLSCLEDFPKKVLKRVFFLFFLLVYTCKSHWSAAQNWKDQFTIVVLEHKKESTYIIEI